MWIALGEIKMISSKVQASLNKLVLGWGLLAAATASGCSCSDSNPATLTILLPADGATLSPSDDADPDMAGIQFEVSMEATRLAAGEEISLFIDASRFRADPVATPDATTELRDDATARITVTLPVGEHELLACARNCGVQSEVVRITVSQSCAVITFVTPEPDPEGMDVRLGPGDDTDGEACGTTFQTDVRISTDAGDGQTAQLFVNGTPRVATQIDGTVANFQNVVLDNRGDTANRLEVEVTTSEGRVCREAFGSDLFVDCEGVSCAITSPMTDQPFLNQSDDTSAEDGFQTDFNVTTDADGVDQEVRLLVDAEDPITATATAVDDGGQAEFPNVGLAEGARAVRAECTDSSGNVTQSGVAMWTVDITPCGATFDSPTADQLFIDDDDQDPSADGIQIAAMGGVSGEACENVAAGQCGTALADGMLSDGSWTGTVTLASTPRQELCVEVTDEAGNVGEARVMVQVRTDAPQLEITSPSSAAKYNLDGTMDAEGDTRTADLDSNTAACDAAFAVDCSEIGEDVMLLREDTMTELATASCDATMGLPLGGRATFASVALPSANDGSSYNVVARQTADRLTGTSVPLSITADCERPAFGITRPMCGETLRPATDDEDPMTAGFQYRVVVLNANNPAPDTTLTLSSGYTDTSNMLVGLSNVFDNADFGAGGMIDIEACGTDDGGNRGCTDACSVNVVDLPTVTITAPADMSALDAGDDCDGGTAGFQLRVQATTDAPDSATATVTVGAGSEQSVSVSGGAIDACVEGAQGEDLPVVVAVTDTRGTGSDTVRVSIDSLPPTDAISTLAVDSVTDRRGGIVRFTWTAVGDTDGSMLRSYEMRCDSSAITTETEWNNADVFSISGAPAGVGAVELEDVSGFRIGSPLECTVRASDRSGSLTPIGNSATVQLDFLQQVVSLAGSLRLGNAFAAAGDLNGDAIDDVVMGGNGAAYLYFGSTGGLGAEPSVTITGPFTEFGSRVAALGDFNADGRNDFAIGSFVEPGTLAGAVYVFFGRDAGTPWPASITVSSANCMGGVDVCFRGDVAVTLFGFSLAGGDVNGDSVSDLVVGRPNPSPGSAVILLGSNGFTSGQTVNVVGDAPSGFLVAPPMGPTSGFGNSVTTISDLNGDGRAEVAIGAPLGNREVFQMLGRAYVGPGLEPVTLTAGDVVEASSTGGFGINTRGLGDVNGDGLPDLGVFATAALGRGFMTVFFGSASGFSSASRVVIQNDIMSPDSDSDQFGFFMGLGQTATRVVGDLDGDGIADILTGSTERGTEVASSEVFYGRDPAVNRERLSADISVQPMAAGNSGNRPTEYIGDVNGDGFDDIAVGEPGTMGSDAGQAWIYY